jgi:hypothetical protein
MLQPGPSGVGEEQGEVADDEVVIVRSTQLAGQPVVRECHTRVLGHQDPGANIITRCAGTKSHTYDESWHMIEFHIFTIQ